MEAIKQHTKGLFIWSAKLSTMALVLVAGSIFGVWVTIQALSYIVQ